MRFSQEYMNFSVCFYYISLVLGVFGNVDRQGGPRFDAWGASSDLPPASTCSGAPPVAIIPYLSGRRKDRKGRCDVGFDRKWLQRQHLPYHTLHFLHQLYYCTWLVSIQFLVVASWRICLSMVWFPQSTFRTSRSPVRPRHTSIDATKRWPNRWQLMRKQRPAAGCYCHLGYVRR